MTRTEMSSRIADLYGPGATTARIYWDLANNATSTYTYAGASAHTHAESLEDITATSIGAMHYIDETPIEIKNSILDEISTLKSDFHYLIKLLQEEIEDRKFEVSQELNNFIMQFGRG